MRKRCVKFRESISIVGAAKKGSMETKFFCHSCNGRCELTLFSVIRPRSPERCIWAECNGFDGPAVWKTAAEINEASGTSTNKDYVAAMAVYKEWRDCGPFVHHPSFGEWLERRLNPPKAADFTQHNKRSTKVLLIAIIAFVPIGTKVLISSNTGTYLKFSTCGNCGSEVAESIALARGFNFCPYCGRKLHTDA